MFTEKVNTTDTETMEQWKRTHYQTHGDKGIQKTNAKVTQETGFYTLSDVSWYDIFFFYENDDIVCFTCSFNNMNMDELCKREISIVEITKFFA